MRFLVARNPDPGSSLPFLIRQPIGSGLVLKVRDSWPRTVDLPLARRSPVESTAEDGLKLE